MGEITNQIAIVLGVLVACFAGPAAALFVLIRRKAKARQSRRSPIGIALLRGPGHSLREQFDEAHNDLTWDLVLLMVLPLLALATFLAQSHVRGLPQTAHLAPVYALAAIAFIAYMLRNLLKASTRLDHLKADADLKRFARHKGGTVFHASGTCRMGGDERSVVDPRLRVRGVDGLRVIDASVMPNVMSTNTNAGTVMIAEKGSAMVLGAEME
jgi:GMC oxidoreductase